ncbi:MAG: glycine--tRNA ligase subunit beta [Chloroflexota bacterium]|nr:glycine--tRNA ligase subunit beta [Chloroflexota bacterium]
MQEIILRLQRFWAEQGAMIWQPYHTELGAGTANPATFLRVLGPEPWNVGYVEPSIRPDDSRYGENPNRLQMHTQFQVILKPDPGNPQELYLASLEALGIDRNAHDIRFVEDNWESPALGAWGLGWEVWLDGMEITQFTYFQQAGGFTLDPVSVEITYGLERIAMRLQGVDHVMDIQYAPGLTYGEIFLLNEYEQSVYNLEAADTERVKQMFDLYEQEALGLLEKGLTIPAYDYSLKTSHTFNILDSRGAIGVTERAAYFNRMRNLSRAVATSWIETRDEMGFPLRKRGQGRQQAPDMSEASWPTQGKVEFLLEVGVEELPAQYVDIAVEALRESAPKMFEEGRLSYDELVVNGTPRRLVVHVRGLDARQSDREEEVRGPAARIAFDEEGNPTKAGLGFARSRGVDVSELERRDVDGTDYVFATVREEGLPAGEVLAGVLADLIGGIPWPRSMRWNESNVAFGRPLRWIVALLNNMVMPFTFAGVPSGRTSRGLRSAGSPEFEISDAGSHLDKLEEQAIIPSITERKAAIWKGAQALAKEVGGAVPEGVRDDLLDEVANLVEQPTSIRGSFDEAYLALPREVLITVMRKHQRYFPVVGQGDGASGQDEAPLLPYFIAEPNGDVDEDVVRHGNQEVLRARYADAQFFWDQDTKKTLEAFRPTLGGLTFQADLGSMLDKSERLGDIVPSLTGQLGLSDEERVTAERAAYLSKADLVTEMVMDFTSLQGIMGRHYALRSGESEAVASAIEEQYSNEPASLPGLVLGLADRLDSLVGLFAVGKAPTATADPFAQRRAAIGVVELLAKRGLRFDLRAAIDRVAETQPVEVSEEAKQEVLDFITRRLEQWLLDRGYPHDVVQAAIAERGYDPAGALETAEQLAAVVEDETFQQALTAYSRPARITRGKMVNGKVEPDLFEHEEETRLWQAYGEAAQVVDEESDFNTLFHALHGLREPIDAYFDKVFVMAEDEAIRTNRLALLKRIADLPHGIVDLSKVRGF